MEPAPEATAIHKSRVRIVSEYPHGSKAKVFVDDIQLTNVVRATVILDAAQTTRAVLEMVDVDIEAVAEEPNVEQRIALPGGPVRLALTHEEAEQVLAARQFQAFVNNPGPTCERGHLLPHRNHLGQSASCADDDPAVES
jgi:hypothetical protein